MGVKTWITGAILTYIIYRVYWFVKYQILQRQFKAGFAINAAEWPLGLDFVKRNLELSKTFKNYEFFEKNMKKYTSTHGALILNQYILFTTDPDNIKAILATQFPEFGKGSFFNWLWTEFLGQGIFNADGAVWSHARALIRPQFLKERVAELHNFEDKIKLVFKLIKSGQETDIRDIWFRFTLDAATEHLFGHCAESLTGDNSFAENFARVQELQTRRARNGPLMPLFRAQNRELTQEIKKMDDYVQKYIKVALERDTDDEDDVSLLSALVKENRDPVFLRDSLVSMLLAGRDTTAATLTWATKHLSHEPAIWAELRREVIDVVGMEAPTYSQLKNMKLLQAVVNETLRLYPIVPMNVRTSFKDTTLPRGGGPDGKSPVLCPANTQVVYSALVMQRTQDIPDVLSWLPHRWLDTEKGKKYVPDHWSYIPFNGKISSCFTNIQVVLEFV